MDNTIIILKSNYLSYEAQTLLLSGMSGHTSTLVRHSYDTYFNTVQTQF